MAVAVKNAPDVDSASVFDRLPVVSLVGLIYVLGSFGIVFKLLPSLLLPVLTALGFRDYGSQVVIGVLMLIAGVALLVGGARLLGPKAPAGARAGIFTCFVGVLLILLLTRWASLWIEHWVFDKHAFGDAGPTAGAFLTGLVGVGLLALGVYWLFKRATERLLVAFEAQGWFSAAGYKPLQGQKVRRGTIIGLVLIALAGIYSLLSHGALRKGGKDWELNIPFTGVVAVDNPGDVGEQIAALPKKEVLADDGTKMELPVVSRYELRAINDQFASPSRWVKIVDAKKSSVLRGKENTLVGRSEYQSAVQAMRDDFERENANIHDEKKRDQLLQEFESRDLPVKADPEPASGSVKFQALTLLPSVQFTVPLLLLAGSLWLSWRVVNLPMFADFLIATEAELNKVSWTTRKRLVQDTIVVLITVFLLAGYLFFMDIAWKEILSAKPIGVLQFPKDQAEKDRSEDLKPW